MSPVVWRVDRGKLREPFADDVNQLLHDDPDTWVVTAGHRERSEQAALYKIYLSGGPRAASPGNSAHEADLAVDVTLVRGGHDIWNSSDPSWRRLVHKVHLHPRLHSLDDIGDTDHIEAVNWRLIASTPRTVVV